MYDYYIEESKRLRNLGRDLNLTEEEIDKIIDDSFKFLETEVALNKECKNKFQVKKKFIWIISFIIALVAVLFIVSNQRRALYGYLERNFQVLFYPCMKLLRKLMLPLLKKFPSVTEWYDEACLIGNPYFQVTDIDCWPCENVKSVLNLTLANLKEEDYHSGIPFITRDALVNNVKYSDLFELYASKKVVFDKDAGKAESSLNGWITADEIFNENSTASNDSHIIWKLNRLEPAREVRALFGSPSITPAYVSGVTVEKWVAFDGPSSPSYDLPWTEGSTVFVMQGIGTRLISLEPVQQCLLTCHRVSVLLRPKHILWFNWWYWRAKSHPVSGTSKVTVTYIGSYY